MSHGTKRLQELAFDSEDPRPQGSIGYTCIVMGLQCHEEVIFVPEQSDSELNPFYHRIFLTPAVKLRVALFTVFVLPLRVIGLVLCLLAGWILAAVGTWGVPEKEIRDKPLSGTRRCLAKYISFVGRLGFKIFGLNVSVKGQQASREEAPVLVVAPHSSFADLAVGLWMGLPHLICRSEESRSSIIGTIMNYCQPIYVARDDQNSRQNTLKEIIRRTTPTLSEWRQVMVFPEGTCSNRQALLTFKPGGFCAAVPVQPVCLHYTDGLDTLTWTWDGPGVLKILWLTMTKFGTNLIIEFLPPVIPNDKEKMVPNLFAENTRLLMASCLGIPTANYSFEDAQLVGKATELGLPSHVGLIEARLLKAQTNYKLNQRILRDDLLVRFARMADKESGLMTIYSFASYLRVSEMDDTLLKTFCHFSQGFTMLVTFKQYAFAFAELVSPLLAEKNLISLHKLRCFVSDISALLGKGPRQAVNLQGQLWGRKQTCKTCRSLR